MTNPDEKKYFLSLPLEVENITDEYYKLLINILNNKDKKSDDDDLFATSAYEYLAISRAFIYVIMDMYIDLHKRSYKELKTNDKELKQIEELPDCLSYIFSIYMSNIKEAVKKRKCSE